MKLPIGVDNPPFLNLPEGRRRLLALPSEEDETVSPIPVKPCLDLGITSYYTTPLSLEDLSNALLPALESHQLQPGDAGNNNKLNILLAEDNYVNQVGSGVSSFVGYSDMVAWL
jgi:osomolarity two-component system sensor histidine kinase NIK1